MTPDHKSGNACPNYFCEGGTLTLYGINRGNCEICNGLGWLPQPGDALTADEARKLYDTHLSVETHNGDGRWVEVDSLSDVQNGVAFRLAPDPEPKREEGESVEETLFGLLKEALQAFECTQNRQDYSKDHWSNRAADLLTPERFEALKKERK